MNVKNTIVTVLSVLTLTACGTPSVDELVKDPELLSSVIKECKTMAIQGEDINIEKCENANKAVLKMSNNMVKGLLGG